MLGNTTKAGWSLLVASTPPPEWLPEAPVQISLQPALLNAKVPFCAPAVHGIAKTGEMAGERGASLDAVVRKGMW